MKNNILKYKILSVILILFISIQINNKHIYAENAIPEGVSIGVNESSIIENDISKDICLEEYHVENIGFEYFRFYTFIIGYYLIYNICINISKIIFIKSDVINKVDSAFKIILNIILCYAISNLDIIYNFMNYKPVIFFSILKYGIIVISISSAILYSIANKKNK